MIEYAIHKKKALKHDTLKNDYIRQAKTCDNVLVLEFDYCQNLPLPKLTISKQFSNDSSVPMKEGKVKDIRDLFPLLKDESKEFYESLFAKQGVTHATRDASHGEYFEEIETEVDSLPQVQVLEQCTREHSCSAKGSCSLPLHGAPPPLLSNQGVTDCYVLHEVSELSRVVALRYLRWKAGSCTTGLQWIVLKSERGSEIMRGAWNGVGVAGSMVWAWLRGERMGGLEEESEEEVKGRGQQQGNNEVCVGVRAERGGKLMHIQGLQNRRQPPPPSPLQSGITAWPVFPSSSTRFASSVLRPPPHFQTVCESGVACGCVKSLDEQQQQHLIKHNIPLSVADYAGLLFRKMFPNSEEAKRYGCGRMKTTAFVGEMAETTREGIVKNLQTGPFSLATDGSNDSYSKIYPLLVTYFSKETQTMVSSVLSLPELEGNATGRNIGTYTKTPTAIRIVCITIPKKLVNKSSRSEGKTTTRELVQCSTDSGSKHQNSSEKETTGRISKKRPFFSYGEPSSSSKKLLLRDRKGKELKIKDCMQSGASREEILFMSYSSPLNNALCLFLLNIIAVFDKFNVILQSSAPQIHLLHQLMSDLLKELMSETRDDTIDVLRNQFSLLQLEDLTSLVKTEDSEVDKWVRISALTSIGGKPKIVCNCKRKILAANLKVILNLSDTSAVYTGTVLDTSVYQIQRSRLILCDPPLATIKKAYVLEPPTRPNGNQPVGHDMLSADNVNFYLSSIRSVPDKQCGCGKVMSEGFKARDIGLRAQKKILGRMMANKNIAKVFIDDTTSSLLDNVYRLSKAYAYIKWGHRDQVTRALKWGPIGSVDRNRNISSGPTVVQWLE
ncbi:hypothetical protein PR048_021677 [Dryococelus australis]|uniref:Uncharacterized protein n=1 Tax=Dryococelus australis TaxID=614101 RepID=A0ABQ9GZ32_9NEOP|nr:hypothetical protein PR048_021677 [Dryococelus australis]